MYPAKELIRLEAYKASLVRSIARRRSDCSAATGTLLAPLSLLEHGWRLGQRLLQSSPQELFLFSCEVGKLYAPGLFSSTPFAKARNLISGFGSRLFDGWRLF